MTALDPGLLARVADAMASVDAAPVIAELAENERLAQETKAAIERTQADFRSLTAEIDRLRNAGPDRDAITDALTRGQDLTTLSRTEAELNEQRKTLHLGLTGLRRRSEELEAAARQVRVDLGDQFAAAGELLQPALAAEADEIIARLMRLFANASAAATVTGATKLKVLAQRLARPVDSLRRLYASDDDLVEVAPHVVDPALCRALQRGSAALRIAGRAVPDAVPFPSRQ
jgi:chromosome segregation ATPase